MDSTNLRHLTMSVHFSLEFFSLLQQSYVFSEVSLPYRVQHGKVQCAGLIKNYEGRSNINRPLSVATSEWARLGSDLVRWCGGVWGPSSPHHQTLPSPKLVEFKISEREVPITIARVVIKFLTNENVWPNEIWRRLRAQYGESTLSKTQVKFWHKEFRGGRDAVQNTSHQWRPRTSTTPENIAAVRDLTEGNRQLTVVEICQELGISYGSVQSIIKTKLQFQKILARWVPRLLSDQQKSRNRRKIGPVVLDCPTTPAVQPGPLPLRLPHVWAS